MQPRPAQKGAEIGMVRGFDRRAADHRGQPGAEHRARREYVKRRCHLVTWEKVPDD
jgi:hypothetical protein